MIITIIYDIIKITDFVVNFDVNYKLYFKREIQYVVSGMQFICHNILNKFINITFIILKYYYILELQYILI